MPFGPAAASSKAKIGGARRISRSEVRSEIERLRRVESHCFRPHHGRFDFYEYLEEVGRLHRKWDDERSYAKLIRREFKLKKRRGKSLLRYLIDASTSNIDFRRNQRWEKALSYALRHYGEWGGLRKRGGLAKFMARRKKKKKKGGISGLATAERRRKSV